MQQLDDETKSSLYNKMKDLESAIEKKDALIHKLEKDIEIKSKDAIQTNNKLKEMEEILQLKEK